MKTLKIALITACMAVMTPVYANDTVDSVKSAASDAYDKTKEVGKNVGEASVSVWEKVKKAGGNAVDATRENVSKFREYSNDKVCEHSETLCKDDE